METRVGAVKAQDESRASHVSSLASSLIEIGNKPATGAQRGDVNMLAEQISKSFAALHGVHFELRCGEVHPIQKPEHRKGGPPC